MRHALNLSGRIGKELFAYKPSDTSRVNDTLLDDPDLTLPIPVSEMWEYEILIQWNASASATPDIKVQVTVPTDAVGICFLHGPQVGTADINNSAMRQKAQAFPMSAEAFGVSATTAFTFLYIRAIVINGGNAGPVALQWAQNTITAGNATVVKARSFMVGRRRVS